MSTDHSAELMRSLIAKLYATVTGEEESIQLPRNKFVTWLLPGVPFTPEDFAFCCTGFTGATAEETLQRYHQAFTLGRLFDYVPEVGSEFFKAEMQQMMFSTTQDTISSVYHDVLKYSRVLDGQLTPEQQDKLKRSRDQLAITREISDGNGGKKTVTSPGPMTESYLTYMDAYLQKVDEYASLLLDAQSARGNDPEAIRRVSAFAAKGPGLRRRMEAAEMAWASLGFRNEYEGLNAYIADVTGRSMVLYKQDLLKKYEQARLTSPADGDMNFFYTTLIPGNFAGSEGWTEFTWSLSDFEQYKNKSTSKWSARGLGGYGLFAVAANAEGTRTEQVVDTDVTKVTATLEFAQVPICRPWFDPGFFGMRAWTLDRLWDLNFEKKFVSDGEEQPTGRLVAYPTTALFVRKVKLTFEEQDSRLRLLDRQIAAKARLGWGPVSLGGSYSRGSDRREQKVKIDKGTLEIEGLQLIGLVNSLVPRCPDTDPRIKPEQLVAGTA